jgi:hypothetical protein
MDVRRILCVELLEARSMYRAMRGPCIGSRADNKEYHALRHRQDFVTFWIRTSRRRSLLDSPYGSR